MNSKFVGPNKSDKSIAEKPTFRFTIVLDESNENTCPEIHYSDLYKNEIHKLSEKVSEGDGQLIGPNVIDDERQDEDERITSIVKGLEARYGTSVKKAKSKKLRKKIADLMDMGIGYDESDSFIDNSEAYDELVPSTMTTKLGGFYINSGVLEFQEIVSSSDDESGLPRTNQGPTPGPARNKLGKFTSVGPNGFVNSKKSSKHSIYVHKDSKSSFHKKFHHNHLVSGHGHGHLSKSIMAAGHHRHYPSLSNPASGNSNTKNTHSKKHFKKTVVDGKVKYSLSNKATNQDECSSDRPLPYQRDPELAVTDTVKLEFSPPPNERIKSVSATEPDPKVPPQAATNNTFARLNNSAPSSHPSHSTPRAIGVDTKENAHIDLVMKLSKKLYKKSLPHHPSATSTGCESDVTLNEATDTHMEKASKPSSVDDLCPEMKELFEELIQLGKQPKLDKSITRFFTPRVNAVLLRIENLARKTMSYSQRSRIYHLLTGKVPCTRDTLVKKAKRIWYEDRQTKLDLTIGLFKKAFLNAAKPDLEQGKGETVSGLAVNYKESAKKYLKQAVTLRLECLERQKMSHFPLNGSSLGPVEESLKIFVKQEIDSIPNTSNLTIDPGFTTDMLGMIRPVIDTYFAHSFHVKFNKYPPHPIQSTTPIVSQPTQESSSLRHNTKYTPTLTDAVETYTILDTSSPNPVGVYNKEFNATGNIAYTHSTVSGSEVKRKIKPTSVPSEERLTINNQQQQNHPKSISHDFNPEPGIFRGSIDKISPPPTKKLDSRLTPQKLSVPQSLGSVGISYALSQNNISTTPTTGKRKLPLAMPTDHRYHQRIPNDLSTNKKTAKKMAAALHLQQQGSILLPPFPFAPIPRHLIFPPDSSALLRHYQTQTNHRLPISTNHRHSIKSELSSHYTDPKMPLTYEPTDDLSSFIVNAIRKELGDQPHPTTPIPIFMKSKAGPNPNSNSFPNLSTLKNSTAATSSLDAAVVSQLLNVRLPATNKVAMRDGKNDSINALAFEKLNHSLSTTSLVSEASVKSQPPNSHKQLTQEAKLPHDNTGDFNVDKTILHPFSLANILSNQQASTHYDRGRDANRKQQNEPVGGNDVNGNLTTSTDAKLTFKPNEHFLITLEDDE